MLKLKKVQILGFKSFCDRTEVVLPGEGIAAVVGPNGCGKSNISDAITWVLGEQSAKSLRGIKMEDVIFAGTRDRKPTGMAEVSLTLFDPAVYDAANYDTSAEDNIAPIETSADWDESALRAQAAASTEAAVAEVQPGPLDDAADAEEIEVDSPQATEAIAETELAPDATATQSAPTNAVVLKIRRRKFHRTPTRAGEIVVTRRLFRTGESEYLLNGKICRLRDIHDIFMGTGLGTESYAIIGQERIGQLLSSKPLDRRSIIEEAAGITRFKTKKRLAELRLESARQNLARVNDIFEEVTRQMGSLKRQAAKAERYAAQRDELRTRLRVVLASRLSQMDAEQAALATEIAALSVEIDAHAAQLSTLDQQHTTGVEQGYALDTQAREAQELSNQAALELERATARLASNQERIAELVLRLTTGEAERAQMLQQLERLSAERESQQKFLTTAAGETEAARAHSQQKQQQAQDSTTAVHAAEQDMERHRRSALDLLTRASNARNQVTQAEESLAGLEREAERLTTESAAAQAELASLGVARGQMSMQFEGLTERLRSLETVIADLRAQLALRREEETAARQRADKLRGDSASLTGRVSSLEALIRDHSYSTDTVRNLFQSNAAAGWKPMGVLAEFLEVDGQYESLVDEFLRDELNYIVVKTWDDAQEAMRLLKSDVEGRATLLVHPEDSQAKFSFARTSTPNPNVTRAGVIPLSECIRVQEGFGKALEVILPKLRDGYITPDAETARQLALENPDAFYLARTGECFHNVTVTGGQPRAEGPLAIKRELRETQLRLDECTHALAQADLEAATLAHTIAALNSCLESESEARRDAERETANHGASLRQMESEVARIERRLQEWALAADRNRAAIDAKRELIHQKQQESTDLETQRTAIEDQLAEVQQNLETLRQARELAQQESAAASAQLAALEERRRGAQASYEQTDRIFSRQQEQIDQLAQQLAAALAERQQRELECTQLTEQEKQYITTRDENIAAAQKFSAQAAELRTRMAELDQQLRALRQQTEAQRELRADRSTHAAKLTSDIEHLEAICISDLGVEAIILREDSTIERLESETLSLEDEACRALKQRLENMGPVNMMALEEYAESQQRHSFLETQRKDLLDSIENTQQSIREIDEVSRARFDEAFTHINANFSTTFSKLFGGGQAFMRLTDQENSAESGVDIVASPPGKKLQNVLLLSGGEKALTALSLLVGIFLYQPAPFCVLDEVDAPLDETNVGRFSKLIEEMSSTTQFIVITHSKGTMAVADMIYGVTMQEPGVSKIVSVKLGHRQPQPQRQAS